MKFRIAIVLLFINLSTAHAQKITDTILYNNRWEICEKPIADYYRIGTLAVDSFWFFIGPVKDYTMDNTLVMSGHYSQDGYKNGRFEFYYPNGQLMQQGNYENDKMLGIWNFFYENGKPKATVLLPENNNDFRFLQFSDSNGTIRMENGTGTFQWHQHELAIPGLTYSDGFLLTGSSQDSLRSGDWKYYYIDISDGLGPRYIETYKKGVLKKARYMGYSTTSISAANIPFSFQPDKIDRTEQLVRDEFINKMGNGVLREDNFVNFIINGESPAINLEDKRFSKAFSKIIATLDRYGKKIDYTDKEVNGVIEFKVSDKGFPEDVNITGNITPKEKKFIQYIMDKFKGIQMPDYDSTVAIEGYHKIYFFTFDPRPFLPASLKRDIPKYFFIFSAVPKDKFLSFASDIKKEIRRWLHRRE
jgi:antitoxin component YwqK of YwqJK toxin-antitoxin module